MKGRDSQQLFIIPIQLSYNHVLCLTLNLETYKNLSQYYIPLLQLQK
jgi:hypothetical protein